MSSMYLFIATLIFIPIPHVRNRTSHKDSPGYDHNRDPSDVIGIPNLLPTPYVLTAQARGYSRFDKKIRGLHLI